MRDVKYASSSLDQLALAEFLNSGDYDRHVRARRLAYRRRRDELVDTLAQRAPRARVTGLAAGLHALIKLPPGTERTVLAAAAEKPLVLYGMSRFRHPDARGIRDGLVVGYATPSASAWRGALDALCDVLS
jgi:GntR family transcriptional regulator/MocR family aminotransferase